MNFIKDDSVFVTENPKAFGDFLKERETATKWYTDEDGVKIKDIRFKPVYNEPIAVSANVATLSASKYPKFTASEEAYLDTMYAPEHFCEGSTQLVMVKGKLMPVGDSAIRGIIERAGIKSDGWLKLKRYSPKELSSVLNSFMRASKGELCVLEQDEKVRAFNSGRYAICPPDYVFDAAEKWAKETYPQAKFLNGIFNHDYCYWNISLAAYTNELFGNVPELTRAGFAPALLIEMSNNGTSAVNLRPALLSGKTLVPLDSDICCPHIAKGKSSERTVLIKEKVENNFNLIFPSLEKAAGEIEALKNVSVPNAKNALMRGLKSIGLPMTQSLEAVSQFEAIYPDSATAFECYLAAVDAYFFTISDIKDNDKKKFEAAESIARAVRINWAALGAIPGTFSW